MSHVEDNSTPPVVDHGAFETKASFLARSKKAIAGGIAAAVTAGGSALTLGLSDGDLNSADAWTIAGAVVGGFFIGFVGVWGAPANAS